MNELVSDFFKLIEERIACREPVTLALRLLCVVVVLARVLQMILKVLHTISFTVVVLALVMPIVVVAMVVLYPFHWLEDLIRG